MKNVSSNKKEEKSLKGFFNFAVEIVNFPLSKAFLKASPTFALALLASPFEAIHKKLMDRACNIMDQTEEKQNLNQSNGPQ